VNKKIPEIKKSVNELEKTLHQTRDADKKLRLNMLLLLRSQESETRIAVAKSLGVSRNTIGRWLSQYEQGGMEALLNKAPFRRDYE
jgi:transposase